MDILRLIVIFVILLLASPAYAVVGIKDNDTDKYVYQIIFPDGTITESGGVGTYTPGAGAPHDPVTLAADIDAVMAVSAGQELSLDTQTANYVFAGPTTGAAADPTFRALVDADIPADIARDTELPTAASLSVDDLITLSGVAGGAVSLGTFTGTTIADNETVKAALQALETALELKAPSTAPTFATSITGSYLTASELLGTGASKEIVSLPVATYPSLTELSYVKGLSSAVQTQINGKQATVTEGSLADSVIVSADVKDGTLVDGDMANDALDPDKLVGDAVDDDKIGSSIILQNAGTDISADLEEEAHVSEHAENGADELTGESLGTACTENQILKANATGGFDCAADATGAGGGDEVSVDGAAVVNPNFASTGQIDFVDTSNTVTANINDSGILEADLKAVDAASDEDVLTYESTTGDFEWHSRDEIIGGITAGALPNDSILEADLKAVDAASDEECLTYETTTGDFEWQACVGSEADTVIKAIYDAYSILMATSDNTPVALTVGEQTVVGRATGGAIAALAIDSDLSSTSASDDTVPSAKAVKAQGDLKLPLAGGTMSGAITLGENTSVALDPAGSVDGKYSGITVTGTAGAALAFGDVIVLDVTDSRWELADANSAAAADGDSRSIIGICVLAAGADGNATTILLHGIVRADTAFPAMTVAAPVYVSETAGDLTSTQPTTTDVVIRILGQAITADELYFNPDNTWTTHT